MVDMCKWQRLIPRHDWSPCYRIAHGWNNWVYNNLQSTWSLMKLKEPRSFSSSFIFFLSFFFFLFFFFLLLRTVGNTMHLLHLPPMLECLLVLKQWSDDDLMEWVHKTLINSLDTTLEIKGASPRERLKPSEEEKGQAGRPRGVEPAGLLPVGLHFFGFFCCEFFDASQTYVLLNFALNSIVLPSK